MKGIHKVNVERLFFSKFEFEVSKRTLQRWTKKLNGNEWDLKDKSRRPKKINYKITPELEKEVISIREKTGWGQERFVILSP